MRVFFVLLLASNLAYADHAAISFEMGTTAAILTTPGATLPQGTLVIGTDVQYVAFDELSDAELEAQGAADEDVHSVGSLVNITANLTYGLSDALTVGIGIPYVQRRDVREANNEMGVGEAEFAGDARGFSDVTLFGQYRFVRSGVYDAALSFGLKTPTGDSRERELEGAKFEAEQQPGSGSWDPFVGLAWSRSFRRFGLSANLLYVFASEGTQDTDLGDVFDYNVAASYRLFRPTGGHDHSRHHHGLGIIDYLDLVLEVNGDFRGHTEISHATDDHSGGNTVYLSPGVRIGLGHTWSAFLSLGIPVVNDLNGRQSEPQYRLFGGVSTRF